MRSLYIYNPTCELAVANNLVSYQAPKYLQNFERDLCFIPAYLGTPKDICMVHDSFPKEFIDYLNKVEVPHALPITKSDLLNSEYKLKNIIPWGWSPALHHNIKEIKLNSSEEFRNSHVYKWNNTLRDLYSREFALNILTEIQNRLHHKAIVSKAELPRIAKSEAEVLEIQKEWPQLVLKSPWSASGRGIQILRRSEFNTTNQQILSGVLRSQKYVMVEKYLNKLQDFAFQFSIENKQVHFKGLSFFSASKGGQYENNYLGNYIYHLNEELISFLNQIKIEEIAKELTITLENSKLSDNYEGNIGVDAMIYKGVDGNLKLQPCLEINCRNNMGNLSLALNKSIAENSYGHFYIKQKKDIDLTEFKLDNVHLKGGKIESGNVLLSPVQTSTGFVAYIKIKKHEP